MSGQIRGERLTMRFGGLTAVDDVSLLFDAGTVHGVIGPNGAGKTTLLNVLSGLARPTAGRVLVDGRDTTRWSATRLVRSARVTRTFQTVRLFGSMDVHDNVLIAAGCRYGRGEAAERADAQVERLGLAEHRHARAASLSYGLQRRVEIARALATDPSVLLLDEPAAGLSPVERSELAELLAAVHAAGTTVVLVEHHMDLVHAICEHCYVLDFGAVLAEGRPSDVTADPRVLEAYLGSPAA